jgi:hypothetical protein
VTSERTRVQLEPFGTLTIQTDPDGLFMLGETSAGKRIIQELLSVRFEGPRLRGSMTGKSAADWLTVDANGNVTLDIRVLLLTDDGAHVFVTLDGRARWGEGLGRGPIYSRANVESGDERYRWVNHVPLVAKGAVAEGGGVAHELFEMV